MIKDNLILHCGAHHASYDDVLNVQTPNRTHSHVPVPHSEVLSLVGAEMTRLGFNLKDAAHGLSHEGNRYFGLLSYSRPAGPCGDRDDYETIVGVRNSHDKSVSAGLVLGSQVFVCDNLSFMGEIKISRKHTAHVEGALPQLVREAVAKAPGALEVQDRRFDTYKDFGLSRGQANDLMVRSFERGACTASQLGQVIKEYRDPRHPEFRDRNAWSLFNAFTEVGKSNSLAVAPERTMALQATFDHAISFSA